MAGKGRPKRVTCTICGHAERSPAEMLLAGGVSQAAVARKYAMSQDALQRHWKNHVTAERKANFLIGPVQRQALAAQVAEESASVLDHHKAVRAGLYRLYDAAIEGGDRTGGALVAGRLTDVNNAIAKITGELASSPLVSHVHNNLTISNQVTDVVMPVLMRALEPFPEARRAVIDAFRSAELSEESGDRCNPILIEAGVRR